MTLEERLFAHVYRIRRVEERVSVEYPKDVIRSPVHLSIGQEAVAAGVCEALGKEDAIFGTYRSHATYIAKGGDLRKMVAELYGKDAGCCRGKGGSMHLIDPEVGALGGSAVVATTIPHAAGWAYANKIRGKRHVAVAMFGDGAVEEGVFYETLNFAALKKLPVIFVLENNGYAIHSPLLTRQPKDNIAERAASFGIPAEVIDDGDTRSIYEATARAVQAIREGKEGPFFIECRIYRWKEHVGIGEDWRFGYRHQAEAQPWIERDPLKVTAAPLSEARRQEIETSIEAEIADAFQFAESAPFPDVSELLTDVYA
ncbi:MAG: thiamine pyrophosphate-dependent dehydrogenase E1 component subunit alpha [Verrucomicrobiaceae bacterium]|jgi:TPP-dependent pyruvate/acetoin dehydrogenase alpha subunit|nr:thiamine pyrophosphate-dependent dehydrogenase E1 component subunit alpha [Verrucomicrobiaceae bacterium]